MKAISKTLILALVVAGFASAPIAFAQEGADAKKPADGQNMQEMMKDQQSNGGMGMMPMMGMMTQMNEMMATCNKMMQAMTPETGEKQPDKG